MSISTPRLYRKPESGVYLIRVLLHNPDTGNFGKNGPKTEFRRSLKTKCPKSAGKIAASINAVLAHLPMSHRADVYDDVHSRVLQSFLGTGGQAPRIEDKADLDNFLGFFRDLNQPGLEDFKQVFVERVARRGAFTEAPAFTLRGEHEREIAVQMMKELAQPELADLKNAVIGRLRGRVVIPFENQDPSPDSYVSSSDVGNTAHIVPDASAPAAIHREGSKQPPESREVSAASSEHASPAVDNPMAWPMALERYTGSLLADKSLKGTKTLEERTTLLWQLHDFMVREYSLPANFCVHAVKKHHISAFIDHSAARPSRRIGKKKDSASLPDPSQTLAPNTMLKRISNLELFFRWAFEEAQTTPENPTTGLVRRKIALRERKSAIQQSYEPFSAEHLKAIFDPIRYLTECRDADHFWAPLLGAHLGIRLGEIVNTPLANIQQHEISGIWYLDLRPEDVKNDNSVRRLPITQPLVDLGFINYVLKLKKLGASTLFPQRNMTSVSAKRQPSKNTSEKFARFLDVCGVCDEKLVFHSFRHTVITAMQYAGVPIHVSQQIVGHAAQDHAIATGIMTREQVRSVTSTVYTHSNIPSLNAPDPFRILKDALEKAVVLPLDYGRLKKAASIVLRHVRQTPTGFETGWPPQKTTYTNALVQELGGMKSRRCG